MLRAVVTETKAEFDKLNARSFEDSDKQVGKCARSWENLVARGNRLAKTIKTQTDFIVHIGREVVVFAQCE